MSLSDPVPQLVRPPPPVMPNAAYCRPPPPVGGPCEPGMEGGMRNTSEPVPRLVRPPPPVMPNGAYSHPPPPVGGPAIRPPAAAATCRYPAAASAAQAYPASSSATATFYSAPFDDSDDDTFDASSMMSAVSCVPLYFRLQAKIISRMISFRRLY